jgi:hypothetical protein
MIEVVGDAAGGEQDEVVAGPEAVAGSGVGAGVVVRLPPSALLTSSTLCAVREYLNTSWSQATVLATEAGGAPLRFTNGVCGRRPGYRRRLLH